MTDARTQLDTEDSPEFNLPKDHWPLPKLSTLESHPQPPANRYVEAAQSAEFTQLRRSFRGFAFPTVVAVLVWYLFYVLTSTYATDMMGAKAIGNVTVGMAIGLLQFPTTWFATWAYVRRMTKRIDPVAARIRSELEGQEAQA